MRWMRFGDETDDRPEHEIATEGLVSREPRSKVTEALYVYTLEDALREEREERESD